MTTLELGRLDLLLLKKVLSENTDTYGVGALLERVENALEDN